MTAIVHRARPERLSDPFHDFTPKLLKKLLATPDNEMTWWHFKNLLGPFLPAGAYNESVYFLRLAFDYILKHDEDALELVTSLVWFASEYADQLTQDGMLAPIKQNLRACLDHWTSHFSVIHFDREACRAKGWKLEYCDHVKNQEVVCEATCDLVQFKLHRDIAEDFVSGLGHHNGDSVKAAWFLEYARSQFDVYQPPDDRPIREMLSDRAMLESAASVVLNTRVGNETSPTYWNDTFSKLRL